MRLAILLFATSLALGAQDTKSTDPSDVNPPVTETDLEIVKRAREILGSLSRWNRTDNRQCPATEQTYSLYCALELATQQVTHSFQHRGAVMQQARFAIDDVLAKGNHYHHRLMNYNNDPKTTFADVQKFFTILDERIRTQLAAQSHR
jgi:hypothetical protein